MQSSRNRFATSSAWRSSGLQTTLVDALWLRLKNRFVGMTPLLVRHQLICDFRISPRP
jgi:hypothetical protein